MNCNKVNTLLSDFIDQCVDLKTSAQIEAHLSQCPRCRKIENELKATRTLLASLPRYRVPSEISLNIARTIRDKGVQTVSPQTHSRGLWLQRKILFRGTAIAATIIMVMFLGSYFMFFEDSSIHDKTVANKSLANEPEQSLKSKSPYPSLSQAPKVCLREDSQSKVTSQNIEHNSGKVKDNEAYSDLSKKQEEDEGLKNEGELVMRKPSDSLPHSKSMAMDKKLARVDVEKEAGIKESRPTSVGCGGVKDSRINSPEFVKKEKLKSDFSEFAPETSEMERDGIEKKELNSVVIEADDLDKKFNEIQPILARQHAQILEIENTGYHLKLKIRGYNIPEPGELICSKERRKGLNISPQKEEKKDSNDLKTFFIVIQKKQRK